MKIVQFPRGEKPLMYASVVSAIDAKKSGRRSIFIAVIKFIVFLLILPISLFFFVKKK